MPRHQTTDDYDVPTGQHSRLLGRQDSQQTGFGRQGRVDWNAVDDVLESIPSEFKDPRFDSLQHVLSTLSSVNAESALEKVSLIDEACLCCLLMTISKGFQKQVCLLVPWMSAIQLSVGQLGCAGMQSSHMHCS